MGKVGNPWLTVAYHGFHRGLPWLPAGLTLATHA